ncbi:MAG: hypothetical protein DSZ28_04245 [Thiothrix sp.]|nr:MAG: hypothetical protein DSZ28_04245 [Thiothrix sp.]
MSCCNSSSREQTETKPVPRKLNCPVNGKAYSSVEPKTISHHLKQSWKWSAVEQGYYFCSDPECDVVYFSEDGSVIKTSELRSSVGVKEMKPDSIICYCYGVTLGDAKSDASIKEFVIQKTKVDECACDTRNPSGRCCLKNFPKQ